MRPEPHREPVDSSEEDHRHLPCCHQPEGAGRDHQEGLEEACQGHRVSQGFDQLHVLQSQCHHGGRGRGGNRNGVHHHQHHVPASATAAVSGDAENEENPLLSAIKLNSDDQEGTSEQLNTDTDKNTKEKHEKNLDD